MSLGTLLQTIIAVIFIYLILSLLASEIQEYNEKICFERVSDNGQPSKDEPNNINVECFIKFIDNIEKNSNLVSFIQQDKNAEEFNKTLDKINKCLKSEAKKDQQIGECLQNEEYNFPTTYDTYRQRLKKDRISQQIDNITSKNKTNFANQVKKQGGLPLVIFGWVISAIAISMGAPFWFDLLGKVMNVRNTKKSTKTNSTEDKQTLD